MERRAWRCGVNVSAKQSPRGASAHQRQWRGEQEEGHEKRAAGSGTQTLKLHARGERPSEVEQRSKDYKRSNDYK